MSLVRICKLPVFGLSRVVNLDALSDTAGSALTSTEKNAAANSRSLPIDGLASGEVTQRLKVDDAPRLSRPVRTRRFEFVEGLPRFGMHRKPVMRTGVWYRLKFGRIGRVGAPKDR